MIKLHDYQAEGKAGVYRCWASGHRNTLLVMPTGSGKTVTFSDIISEYKGASCAIAHRQELVSQISVALARVGLRHALMAPKGVIRSIVSMHMNEVGRSYYEPNARCRVAGVDTLVRMDPADPWLGQVGLWVQDEGHHLLRENKWGKAVGLFKNAYGLIVTATPTRADGKGLGRDADGVVDAMVEGPTMRELIDRKFLTPYRVFAPPSDIDLSDVNISAGGDFSPEPLRKAVHRSHIVGDVVQHYMRIAPGKLGVTFAVDIESATEIAQAYRNAGVPAEVVSSKTPDLLRQQILAKFKRREILQLVNVDLFGEGFDLPAIEVVSFARPTASYGLYVQQFGRALRVMEGKTHAIIIDHVGNVHRHGLPDAPRTWSLARRERQTRSTVPDAIPVQTCVKCLSVFERIYPRCIYCGHYEPPAGRSTPKQVDGDLYELSEETLKMMRGELDRVDGAPVFPRGIDQIVTESIRRKHWDRQQAQKTLRHAMMVWGGGHRVGRERESQREFFLKFGIDVMTAMTLGATAAAELQAKIEGNP